MALFDFLKCFENNSNIIYVLDRLLQISVDGEEIDKSRRIDFNLYKILNSPEVNQEIIHTGCLPVIRREGQVTGEYMGFINNLSMYMEYDINSDYLWAMTSPGLTPDKSKQKDIHKKMVLIRKQLLQYLFDKKLVSSDVYNEELNRRVKSISE